MQKIQFQKSQYLSEILQNKIYQENLKVIQKFEKEKLEQYEKNRFLTNILQIKDSEFKICKLNSEGLQQEINILRDLLKKDVISLIDHLDTLENVNKQGQSQNQDNPSVNLIQGTEELNEQIANLEKQQSNRNDMIENMNILIKSMINNTKKDVQTQVDESDLVQKHHFIFKNTPQNRDDFKDSVNYSIKMDPEQKVHDQNIDYDHQKNNIDIMLQKDKTALTLKNLQGQDINTVKENWNIPICIVVFLENVTRQSESSRVLPWNFFKNIINDIYIKRINNSSEINGCISKTFISMDEFICLYFFQNCKIRRLAELKLLEFLVSLKYYNRNYQKAQTFANMCNITSYTSKKFRKQTSQFIQPGNIENTEIVFDIYAQNYYLYAFTKIDQTLIYETVEGFNWIKKEYLEDIIRKIVVFGSEQQKKTLILKIENLSKKIQDVKSKSGEKVDQIDAVDMDIILENIMEFYFEIKQGIQRSIQARFNKIQDSDKGLISLDEIKNVLLEVVTLQSSLEGFSYPKQLTITKLALHAVTSSQNKNDIKIKEFIAACSKFGIDCPFPFIRILDGMSNVKVLGNLQTNLGD